MGLSGIPWWTTDIGGFHGGNPDDPVFPRMHHPLVPIWRHFVLYCVCMAIVSHIQTRLRNEWRRTVNSGAPNEVWSYGKEAFEIFKKYIFIRERLRPYITELNGGRP